MIEKIKVLQIIPYLGLGGAEIMLENLTLALVEEGLDVEVVSLYNYHSAITSRLENKNIVIHYLYKKKGLDIKMIFALYRLFQNKKPIIIHTHLSSLAYVIVANFFFKVPIKIHTIHNVATRDGSKIQRIINKLIYKYCGVIPVSISPKVKKSIIEEYKFSGDRIPMIYNGIFFKKFIPKDSFFSKTTKITILHIGRFSEQKNHIGIIDSFDIVHTNNPNTVLKLIGIGNLQESIKCEVKKLNLEECVEFLDLKTDVYPYLREADIFILPSLWEGMPITLIEAMSMGIPIVATNVGGIPDMIEDNVTGLLVEIDKCKIADALQKLINDSNLRYEIGHNASISAKKFSAKKMAVNYCNLYKEEIINKKH